MTSLSKFQPQQVGTSRTMHRLIQRLSMAPDMRLTPIITFIAARSREGTSTVAMNYALALASETGKKVLLIDAGPATPERFQAYGVDGSMGIIDAMVAGKSPDRAIHASDQGIHICRWFGHEENRRAAGQILHDAKFWQNLQTAYDSIIIDAPSLHSSFDGVLLAARADATVIVVEAEKTPEPVVINLRDILAGSGARLAGVVMNKRRFYIPQRVYKKL